MAAKTRTRRDGLGQFCFWLHLAILLFIVAGWALPNQSGLLVYLVFLPVMVLHWKLNNDACILSNIENWLRHRRWRAPDKNEEEGAWFKTLIRNSTGVALTARQTDFVTYGAILLFWALALLRLLFLMPYRFAV